MNMQHSALNEKKILSMVDSPFIVRLYATYNGVQSIYLLLEAALGGELFSTYEKHKFYGSVPYAQFYVGCVVEALHHLHQKSIIYRDLKPENLLLDKTGYCKLTDMGLAKICDDKKKAYTLVGTPDYMAPEVIECTGHDESYDWWMTGILTFELLVGHAPFEAENSHKVQEKIKSGGMESIRPFPRQVPQNAEDLIRRLCTRDPNKRLRTPKLREHNFFAGFDWRQLQAQAMKPPYLPAVKGPKDLTNFRNDNDDGPQIVPLLEHDRRWDNFEDESIGFRLQQQRLQQQQQMQPQHQPPSQQSQQHLQHQHHHLSRSATSSSCVSTSSYMPPIWPQSNSKHNGTTSVPPPRQLVPTIALEGLNHGSRPFHGTGHWHGSSMAPTMSAPKVGYGTSHSYSPPTTSVLGGS